MRKYLLLLIVVLMLTGCSFGKKSEKDSTKSEGTITCNLSSDVSISGYSIKGEYIVHYKNDLVESVESKEIVNSDDSAILETFEETTKTLYDTMNSKYGGYTLNLERKSNQLISTATIDYNKMDVAGYAKDNTILAKYVSNGKFTLDGIKLIYEQMGAICK